MGDWLPPGVPPESGVRYEFEDSLGARFTATLAAWQVWEISHDGMSIRFEFDDREPFITNMPIRFRETGMEV